MTHQKHNELSISEKLSRADIDALHENSQQIKNMMKDYKKPMTHQKHNESTTEDKFEEGEGAKKEVTQFRRLCQDEDDEVIGMIYGRCFDYYINDEVGTGLSYKRLPMLTAYLKEWKHQAIREAREEKHTNLVNEIKWWLFDSGKFTNNDLLKFKKRFEPVTNSH